ncbi:Protein of unknown function, partial [Cotesia congregata]
LRLAIGAFRTSPTTCILAEAKEIPLRLKRIELSIRFMTKTLAENPNFITNNNHLNVEYQKHPNTPRPLRIRIQDYLTETNLTLPKTFKRQLHPIAPWETIEIISDYNLNERDKKITTAKTFQALFQKTKEKYSNHLEFYTDGSKTKIRTGYAAINEDKVEASKLPDTYSISSCELYAIMKALQLGTKEIKNIVIYTDSKSSIQALEDQFSTNPIYSSIHHHSSVTIIVQLPTWTNFKK